MPVSLIALSFPSGRRPSALSFIINKQQREKKKMMVKEGGCALSANQEMGNEKRDAALEYVPHSALPIKFTDW
jgi:hypothetical protein